MRPSALKIASHPLSCRPLAGEGDGFTLPELLVVLGCLVVLLSIFVPYAERLREVDRRTRCADNLNQIRDALAMYAMDNHKSSPRVVYNETGNPNGYNCYTGADAPSAFVRGTSVRANDVTASLWLLVRHGYVRPKKFICPSTTDIRDDLADADGHPVKLNQRSNFRRHSNLSYSYASPFSSAYQYRTDDTRPGGFAVLADKNPGRAATQHRSDEPPLGLAPANSKNHRGAGENVLFADGHVAWESTPYCGVAGDSIYTALAPEPLKGEHPAAMAPGYLGRGVGPAYSDDSYLVPTAEDR
jgi:prepilin-type processing-associated H-X9-DG protein